eukprot:Clim_evm4s214 gene=Clim_evmTU4s214
MGEEVATPLVQSVSLDSAELHDHIDLGPRQQTLRVGLLQFCPFKGEPERSREKASKHLSGLVKHVIDLLVLPEMSFVGYCFRDREHVLPFAEVAESKSPTITWAISTAKSLKCTVLAGFPRRDPATDNLYNSAVLARPTGQFETYDKHFLYDTDETWATPGAGFRTLSVELYGETDFEEIEKDGGETTASQQNGIRVRDICTIGLGICMDINPEKFKTPFSTFEFANFHKDSGAEVIVVMCAWVDHVAKNQSLESDTCPVMQEAGARELRRSPKTRRGRTAEQEHKVLHDTHSYWTLRMKPLMQKEMAMVVCNRNGVDRPPKTFFVGGSAAVQFGKDLYLINALGCGDEGVMLAHCHYEKAK